MSIRSISKILTLLALSSQWLISIAPIEATASGEEGKSNPETKPVETVEEEAIRPAPAPNIARLGRVPDWSNLDPYQETMSREEFIYLLRHCYVRNDGDFKDYLIFRPDRVLIMRQSNYPEAGYYELRFKPDRKVPDTGSRYWRPANELNDLPENSSKPLQDLVIAVDPGHIGGEWTTWDDRHFTIGKDTIAVEEGVMTLKVAKILEHDLTQLGATVVLTRATENPVTPQRVEDLHDEARTYLIRKKKTPSSGLIAATAKRMFAISSEIRSRADLVNEQFQPDLALCLHFNASPWGRRPSFRSSNHLHLLINGCYAAYEVAEDDTRLEMLMRILQRIYYEEVALADQISATLQDETGLPAAYYDGTNGKSINDNNYVWSRNLLANRMFMCPVIFFEPYCMNHVEVHDRVQQGEYRGLREINGEYRKNIYQEYADGVTAGLVKYFRKNR